MLTPTLERDQMRSYLYSLSHDNIIVLRIISPTSDLLLSYVWYLRLPLCYISLEITSVTPGTQKSIKQSFLNDFLSFV